MGVIMHYPTTPEKQEELSKKVAAVHAQTVMEQIKAMPCPVEQKAELIEASAKGWGITPSLCVIL